MRTIKNRLLKITEIYSMLCINNSKKGNKQAGKVLFIQTIYQVLKFRCFSNDAWLDALDLMNQQTKRGTDESTEEVGGGDG